MKNKRNKAQETSYLILFLFMGFAGFSQIKGIVKDSLTGQPIPYVSVWVENETIGTTAEENGTFSLEVKTEKRIVFSALGYENKIVLSSDVNTVVLSPKTLELNEVVIEKTKATREIAIGDFSGIYLNSGVANVGQEDVHVWAKLIRFNEKVKEHPFIKSIEFATRSRLKNALLRIRVFNINSEEIPIGDAIEEDILVQVKKGKNNNIVDLAKYNIKIPEEGIFIGFEYLKLEQNKLIYKGEIVGYEPSILGFFPGGENLAKLNREGKFFSGVSGQFGNIEIALKIKLTN